MLKILHLSAPTALAGAERVMLNYLHNYNASNVSVHVVSLLNFQRLDNPFTDAISSLEIPFDKIPIGNTSLFKQISQIINILKLNKINILHTHGYRADVTGFVAARIAGIPIVSTVHGWTPISMKLRSYEALDRFFLKRFEKVICVSKPLFTQLLQQVTKTGCLVYVPNAVAVPDLSTTPRELARKKLGCKPSELIVLSAGRLSKEKGIDILLEAFANLSSSDKVFKLIIAGDGPLRSELQNLANNLGIHERVNFAGYVNDVSTYYAAADVFVMSSHTEGSPMALMEAMSWGLPVVATEVGGIPDIVQDGHNGCLVPPADAMLFRAALEKVLYNGAFALRLSEMARRTIINNFSIEMWVKKIELVYEQLVSAV